MKSLIWLWVLLVQIPVVWGLELLTITRGSWTVRLIYNQTALSDSEFQMVRVNATTQEIWFMAVWQEGTSQYWGCRIESTAPVVVGPRGCSNPQDIQAALDSANCISGDVEAEERLELFLQTWQLEAYTAECELNGGDPRLCLGPLRLSLDNRDSFVPLLTPTQADLLSARYFFVDFTTGPYCASPAISRVPMKRPKLLVNITDGGCLADGVPFNGTYEVFGRDTYSGQITDVWMTFANINLPTFQLLLKRYGGVASVDFKMYLAVRVGDADYYDYFYLSNSTFSNLSPQGLFGATDWLQVLDLTGATEYGFTNASVNGTTGCSLSLRVLPETLYQLDPVVPPDATNYYLNKQPRKEWGNQVCGIFYGRLDEDLSEYYEDCPMGDKCGGDCLYTHPTYPNMPVYVPPDSTLQYRFDCQEFYPTNSSFLDYGVDGITGRTERSRMDVDREICFAPFVVPSLVQAAVFPNEKYLQCQKRGGYVFGAAETVCAKPITTQTECKLGWIYFDQKCFYKFSPTTENSYLSSLELSDTTCARLQEEAVGLVQVDQYTETWLLNEYLYWKQDPDNTASYRIPNPNSPDCICFSTLTYTRTSCACQEEHFPICYYPIDTPTIVVPYQDTLVSLQTARVWQEGQVGPEFGGFQAQCKCFIGWTGKNCERATCPLSTLVTEIQSDPRLEQQQLLTFFSRCYQENRGSCMNGQSRVCQCNYGYGPSASILPSLTLLYPYRWWPCACPAGTATSGNFSVDGNIFSGQAINLPCAGLDHGACIAGNTTSTAPGVCESVQRENVNPSLAITEDAVYDGKATTCMRALQPWQGHTLNGPIISELCNAQGTCCPFGQSAANPLVGDKYSKECFDDFGVPQQGCQCENGWGGEACTCPTPFNLADERIQQENQEVGALTIDLGAAYLITQVNVSSAFGVNRPGEGCSVASVEISNEPGRSAESQVCTLNTTLQTVWDCQVVGSELAYRWVVIYPLNTVSTSLTDCLVAAWGGPYFTYCGEQSHVNEFAGRFYDISEWRGPQQNLMPQFAYVASSGCTPTTCMCNSNWDGPLCKWGASSIRQVENEVTKELTWAKVLCGETILVPTLENPVRGRGELGEDRCDCNAITNVDPTGRVGRTTERFTAEACVCTDVYVPDKDEVIVCAGHGDCIQRDLPEGRCEVDYDNYLADSLSEPFVEVTGFLERDNTLTLLQEGYFIGPSQPLPTTAPTAAPTVPTAAPTDPFNKMLLFTPPYTQGLIQNMGVRSQVDGECETLRDFYGIQCDTTPRAVVCTEPGDHVRDFPDTYGLNFDLPVYAYPGLGLIAPSVWSMLNGSLTTLLQTPESAGVVQSPQAGPGATAEWTFCNSTGHFYGNCLNFTTFTGDYDISNGRIDIADEDWIYISTSCIVMPVVLADFRASAYCMCESTQSTVTPTTSPTTSPLSPTASPTVPRVGNITLVSDGTTSQGDLGDRATTDAVCEAVVAGAGVICNETTMLLSYTGDAVGDFPTKFSFEDTSPVYGPTGTLISSSWADMFLGGSTSLSSSLNSASVGTSFTEFWSGTDNTGLVSTTCQEWTSTLNTETGSQGDPTATDDTWISTVPLFNNLCDQLRTQVCFCFQEYVAPTPAPTPAPTTLAPTASPTPYSQPVSDLVLYRGAATSTFTINGMLDSMDYCPSQTENEPPTGLGGFTPGQNFVPLWWSDLYFLYWNRTTNSTQTGFTSRCNPAYQAQPPGTSSPDGPCPFLDPCGTITTLSPDIWTVDTLARGWPDLRGCVLNYTEEVRTDVGPLLSGSTYTNIQAQCVPSATAASSKAITNAQISFGTIQCNSFIDRTVNCALFLLVPSYELQCQEDPIACFSFDIGKFFGGFDQQHPLVKFATVPRRLWTTTTQYKMIASVVNNLFYSIRGSPVDPLNQLDIWNDYIQTWITSDLSTTNLEVPQGSSSLPSPVLVADLVQGRPQIYTPQTGEWQLDEVWGAGQADAEACLAGTTTNCYSLTYTATSSAPLKLPGVWQAIQLPENNTYVITLKINTRFTGVELVAGVEVYNQNGGLCGSLLRPLVEGEDVYFSCVGTYGNVEVGGRLVWVRYLGLQPIWDIAQTVLDAALGTPTDDVAEVLQAGTDFTYDGLYNTVLTAFYGPWNLIAATWQLISGFYQPNSYVQPAWPQRNGTLSGVDLAEMASYNLTVVVGTAVLSGATAWDNITDSILLNFTYPPNTPLANSLGSFWETTPVDFSNQTHLDQLYYIWAAHLAPRQCGGDDSQCKQFGRGRCSFPLADAFKQAWWQGEDPYNAPYLFQGNEGGCRCYNEYARGFWSNFQACRTCVDGYGPSTLQEWSRTVQYSELLNPLFSSSQFPFSQTYTDADTFFSEIACRLPYAKDPLISSFQDVVLCAGHGNVTAPSLTNTTFSTKVFTDSFGRSLVPLCTGLDLGGSSFSLSGDITDANNLVYSGVGEVATVVNGALYTQNGTTLCTLGECSQRWPQAPLCSYECGGVETDVLCTNPLLFTTEATSWKLNGTFVRLSPVSSSVFLGWY